MTVLLNTLQRILKNKLMLLMIIILPPIVMVPMGINMRGHDSSIKVAVVDSDRTEYTSLLTSAIGERAELMENIKEDVEDAVINRRVDLAVEIPRGFTDSLLSGAHLPVKTYHRENTITYISIEQFTESFIEGSSMIAQASGGDRKLFYNSIKAFKENGLKVREKNEEGMNSQASYLTIGVYLMFMMMTTVFFTTMVLVNKENKTMQRTLVSPVSLKNYMLQMIGAFLIISYLQVIVVLLIMKIFMGVYFGENIVNMFLLFVAASVMSVSFGIAISSMSKSLPQACISGLGIMFPMTFIGGCWWRNSISPELISALGRFTPVYWFMEGVSKLIDNKPVTQLGFEILMVLLFSVGFFLFGTWKREDMAI